jgi:hypothetical protein
MTSHETDFMAPFISIPYFVLIYNIFYAAMIDGLDSLHHLEEKMQMVLLYSFLVTLKELILKIKTITDAE